MSYFFSLCPSVHPSVCVIFNKCIQRHTKTNFHTVSFFYILYPKRIPMHSKNKKNPNESRFHLELCWQQSSLLVVSMISVAGKFSFLLSNLLLRGSAFQCSPKIISSAYFITSAVKYCNSKKFSSTKNMSDATSSDGSSNVFGEPLQSCCFEPMTGFYRDGKIY